MVDHRGRIRARQISIVNSRCRLHSPLYRNTRSTLSQSSRSSVDEYETRVERSRSPSRSPRTQRQIFFSEEIIENDCPTKDSMMEFPDVIKPSAEFVRTQTTTTTTTVVCEEQMLVESDVETNTSSIAMDHVWDIGRRRSTADSTPSSDMSHSPMEYKRNRHDFERPSYPTALAVSSGVTDALARMKLRKQEMEMANIVEKVQKQMAAMEKVLKELQLEHSLKCDLLERQIEINSRLEREKSTLQDVVKELTRQLVALQSKKEDETGRNVNYMSLAMNSFITRSEHTQHLIVEQLKDLSKSGLNQGSLPAGGDQSVQLVLDQLSQYHSEILAALKSQNTTVLNDDTPALQPIRRSNTLKMDENQVTRAPIQNNRAVESKVNRAQLNSFFISARSALVGATLFAFGLGAGQVLLSTESRQPVAAQQQPSLDMDILLEKMKQIQLDMQPVVVEKWEKVVQAEIPAVVEPKTTEPVSHPDEVDHAEDEPLEIAPEEPTTQAADSLAEPVKAEVSYAKPDVKSQIALLMQLHKNTEKKPVPSEPLSEVITEALENKMVGSIETSPESKSEEVDKATEEVAHVDEKAEETALDEIDEATSAEIPEEQEQTEEVDIEIESPVEKEVVAAEAVIELVEVSLSAESDLTFKVIAPIRNASSLPEEESEAVAEVSQPLVADLELEFVENEEVSTQEVTPADEVDAAVNDVTDEVYVAVNDVADVTEETEASSIAGHQESELPTSTLHNLASALKTLVDPSCTVKSFVSVAVKETPVKAPRVKFAGRHVFNRFEPKSAETVVVDRVENILLSSTAELEEPSDVNATSDVVNPPSEHELVQKKSIEDAVVDVASPENVEESAVDTPLPEIEQTLSNVVLDNVQTVEEFVLESVSAEPVWLSPLMPELEQMWSNVTEVKPVDDVWLSPLKTWEDEVYSNVTVASDIALATVVQVPVVEKVVLSFPSCDARNASSYKEGTSVNPFYVADIAIPEPVDVVEPIAEVVSTLASVEVVESTTNFDMSASLVVSPEEFSNVSSVELPSFEIPEDVSADEPVVPKEDQHVAPVEPGIAAVDEVVATSSDVDIIAEAENTQAEIIEERIEVSPLETLPVALAKDAPVTEVIVDDGAAHEAEVANFLKEFGEAVAELNGEISVEAEVEDAMEPAATETVQDIETSSTVEVETAADVAVPTSLETEAVPCASLDKVEAFLTLVASN
ncbi:hypothetical protein AC1031_021057 [Aphanomyces cochlioides]|nr:hypothetical protein AC1031_021057 [Aphanomyces cochlioides]